MKSLRLKSRKHSKSRKLTKGRKLRKGGNGPSSSSSSQVTFDYLSNLLLMYSKTHRDNFENEIISIFRNNRFDLLNLTSKQFIKIVIYVLDTHNEKIFDAYIYACNNTNTNYKDHVKQAVQLYKNQMEYILSTMDDSEIDSNFLDTVNKLKKINEVVNVDFSRLLLEHEHTVNNMSFLPKEKDPGPNALSTDRGLLPDPLASHVMSYLHGKNYKNKAEEPMQYSTVVSNMHENIKTMPSREKTKTYLPYSEVDGGRRTRRKSIRKKSRRRKTRIRK